MRQPSTQGVLQKASTLGSWISGLTVSYDTDKQDKFIDWLQDFECTAADSENI